MNIDKGRTGVARYPVHNPFLNIDDYPPVYFNETDRRKWYYGQETFNKLLENGNVVFYKTMKEKGENKYSFYIKQYLSEIKRNYSNISTSNFCSNEYVNTQGTNY